MSFRYAHDGARMVADEVGVKLSRRRPGLQWNGASIATGGQDVANVIHDIAHWIVCPRRRRMTVEFGLGAGPDTSGVRVRATVIGKKADHEECLASLLGIAIEWGLGEEWRHTVSDHSWDQSGAIGVEWWAIYHAIILDRRGLLDMPRRLYNERNPEGVSRS